MLAGSAFAGETARYRVTYTRAGLGKKITVLAESTADARQTVQALFPGATITDAHRAGK
jgi:hypothetical protein